MSQTISHAPPSDEWWDEEEEGLDHETYTCELCGRQEETPAIVLFGGEGAAMIATEICSQCAGALRLR